MFGHVIRSNLLDLFDSSPARDSESAKNTRLNLLCFCICTEDVCSVRWIGGSTAKTGIFLLSFSECSLKLRRTVTQTMHKHDVDFPFEMTDTYLTLLHL